MSAPTIERERAALREPVVRPPAHRTGPHVDVTGLPDHGMGHHDSTWWGTAGFILIEGMTLAVCLASYFYLSRNFGIWPPPRTAPPGWVFATANVLLVLGMIYPSHKSVHAAETYDAPGCRRWLLVLSVLGTLMLAIRWFEFLDLRTRWDEHAYGSIVWATLAMHTAIIASDWADTVVLTAIFLRGKEEKKHYSAVLDNATYWYFVAATFVAVYATLVIAPRVM